MIIPVDYAQANFIFSGGALPFGAECTLGFNVELYSGDPADAALDIANTVVAEDLMVNCSDDIVLDRVRVKFGPNATGPEGEVVATVAGGITGESAAPNTTFLIRKNTGFGGRTGRGRMYWPGVPEAGVDADGDLSGTYASDVTAKWAAALPVFQGQGLVPVLLHSAGSPVSVPLPITGFVCDLRAATQRRRMRR